MAERATADKVRGYTRQNGVVLIEIRINTLAQLFNTLDPAPFREKDLNADAEEYIVGAANELPLPTPLRLVIDVPADQLAAAERAQLPEAIHHYFAYSLEMARRRLRAELRQGRLTLAIGLVFLFVCLSLRQLIPALWTGAAAQMVREGLIIVGWVAMWRPLEIFLYNWWPIRQICRIYAKLAEIPVEVRAMPQPQAAPTLERRAPAIEPARV